LRRHHRGRATSADAWQIETLAANRNESMVPTFADHQFVPDETSEFVDRRGAAVSSAGGATERRQFANSHDELSVDARELARAIDQYKLMHRRRFITFEEMLSVVKSLGYHK
jgi:hypothetical protein